jgi:hypothetical protein
MSCAFTALASIISANARAISLFDMSIFPLCANAIRATACPMR